MPNMDFDRQMSLITRGEQNS